MNPETNIHTPFGSNFPLEAVREIAVRYGAKSFVEWQPTDRSDNGYLLNPNDTPNQFGVATYETSNGFVLTHSIADFIPASVRNLQGLSGGGSPAFVNVLDISVPYFLPHVIVTPRIYEGFTRFLATKGLRSGPLVELEGGFSDFVYVTTAEGQELDAFVYLAPNIMEVLLTKGTRFTVEFVSDHIYVYYQDNQIHALKRGENSHFTPEIHEDFIRQGLAIADLLARAARPAKLPTDGVITAIPIPSFLSAFVITFWPVGLGIFFAMFFFVPGIHPIVPLVGWAFVLSVFARRYITEAMRYARYKTRFGSR